MENSGRASIADTFDGPALALLVRPQQAPVTVAVTAIAKTPKALRNVAFRLVPLVHARIHLVIGSGGAEVTGTLGAAAGAATRDIIRREIGSFSSYCSTRGSYIGCGASLAAGVLSTLGAGTNDWEAGTLARRGGSICREIGARQ